MLSPATLPWYVSWGMALLAAAPWSPKALSWLVFFSLMLLIFYYPNGEDALYNWPYLAACAALAALAAVSLRRVDPLGLTLRSTRPARRVASRMPSSGPAELDAAGITDPALRAAYATCRALNAAHGRTYFLATPAAARGPAPGRARALRLRPLRRRDRRRPRRPTAPSPRRPPRARRARPPTCDAALDGAPTRRPRARRRWPTRARRYAIDRAHFTDFMASMRMDTTVTEYATFDDLAVYVHGSAAVIGLQMLPILGTRVPRARGRAARGRARASRSSSRTSCATSARTSTGAGSTCRATSWPRSASTGSCSPGAAGPAARDPRVRRALAHLVAHTRGTYRRAEPGIAMLEPVSRACVGCAFTLYRGHPRRDRGGRVRRAAPAGRGADPAARRRRAAGLARRSRPRALLTRSSSHGHAGRPRTSAQNAIAWARRLTSRCRPARSAAIGLPGSDGSSAKSQRRMSGSA